MNRIFLFRGFLCTRDLCQIDVQEFHLWGGNVQVSKPNAESSGSGDGILKRRFLVEVSGRKLEPSQSFCLVSCPNFSVLQNAFHE
jgi:hypothetical protein